MSTIHAKNNRVHIDIMLLSFQDEDDIHYVYAPQLDLTGYGVNPEEAVKSFEVVLHDFFDYTMKKKTLEAELKRLGWKKAKKAKYIEPAIADLPAERFTQFFDEYPQVMSKKLPLHLPAFA